MVYAEYRLNDSIDSQSGSVYAADSAVQNSADINQIIRTDRETLIRAVSVSTDYGGKQYEI